jgi:hypothetical protein
MQSVNAAASVKITLSDTRIEQSEVLTKISHSFILFHIYALDN